MSHPAFTPQPQSITTLWPVLISCPTVGRRLSWTGFANLILLWYRYIKTELKNLKSEYIRHTDRNLWIRSWRCGLRSTFLFLVLLGVSFAAWRATGMLSMQIFQWSNVLFEEANTIGFQRNCLECSIGLQPRTNLSQHTATCYIRDNTNMALF